MAPRTSSKTKTTAASTAEKKLENAPGTIDQSAELDARQAELEKREAALKDNEADFAKRTEAIDALAVEIKAKDNELFDREQALDAREAEIKLQQDNAPSKTSSDESQERRSFAVLKSVRINGKRQTVGDELNLTKDEHTELSSQRVVLEDWADGLSPD